MSYLASELDKRFEAMMARVEAGHMPDAKQLNQLWSGWRITRGLLLTKEQDIKRQYELTETDAKTGLINKTGLHRMLLALDARTARPIPPKHMGAKEQRKHSQKKAVHAIRIDVEGLKELRERYEHQVSDAYVTHIGRSIRGACRRSSDIVARAEKNAFLVLGFGMPAEGAEVLSKRILAAVRAAVEAARKELVASGSLSARAMPKVSAIIAYAELDECPEPAARKKETITQLAERIDAAMLALRGTKPDRIVPHKEFMGACKCARK